MTASTKEEHEKKAIQKSSEKNSTPVSSQDITERAYKYFVHRGCAHGFDEEDWFRAEQELIDEAIGKTT